MSDANNLEFTPEELLSQAQGNATAFVLTTFAYLKEHGLAVDDYVAYFGRRVASGWEELRGRPVVEVARTAALNVVSVAVRYARFEATIRAPRCSAKGGQIKNS